MGPSLTFKTGVRDVLPTVFGYIGVGLAFGIVAHTSHLSLLVVAGLSFTLDPPNLSLPACCSYTTLSPLFFFQLFWSILG